MQELGKKKIRNNNLQSVVVSEKLLDVKNLYTYFFVEEGIVKAVDGVTFSIKKNEIMGLVGETGCGKSVTALSILKLIRSPGEIIGGKILFNGEDLVEKTTSEIRKYRGNKITMIFQDPLNSLNPVLRVGEQISEVYKLHQMKFLKEEKKIANTENKINKQNLKEYKKELKEIENRQQENLKITENNDETTIDDNKRQKIEKEIEELNDQKNELQNKITELKFKVKWKISINDIAFRESAKILRTVGLADTEQLLYRFPHELSGGMRQRIMISMGLACNSQLLICDEPTTALDVTIQAQILELIRELKRKLHNSVLFITHNLGVIYELCDTVAVMYSGNIIEYGSVSDIMESPLHPYTQGLLAAIPRVSREFRGKKLQIIKGMVPNLIYPPSGCRFHPRCKYSMKICKEYRPELEDVAGLRKVACFLFHKDKNNPEKKELFKELTEEQKEEYL
ncbi:MAG: oligopeptide/dipeptide ABC transporter ATP-binding protein [Promethearchaeota archaeon]